MKKTVKFYSEGQQIAGELYLPDDIQENQKLPAVVLCHGFAGIKELLLPPYAEKFAQNGLAALTFDYRGFGESEGERGRLVPAEQMADIRNALTFAQTLPEIDEERIGLWGTSFGGANAINVAALDKRVKAIAVQLTFANGERMVKGDLEQAELDKLQATLKKTRERAVTKNKVLKLTPNQILTDEESKAFFARVIELYPQLRETKIPFLTLQHNMEHNPEQWLSQVECPILIIAAEKDKVCPPAESDALFNRANEPKKLILLEGCSHYEAYEGNYFKIGAEAVTAWFSSHL
jgi:fermentation-respiration switch protein FrsA (DUF1100 family)